MARKRQWLVVGAGFTGAVVASKIARDLDEKVLVIDRRDHIGGNAFDERNAAGDLVHRYGPHIFHTNSKRVFDYLSAFTEWRPYFHHVLAHVDGMFIPVPFNLNSLAQVFPEGLAARLSDKLIEKFGYGGRPTILRLRAEATDPDLRFLAEFVYDKVFVNYTTKQWGLPPDELDPSVTARVPVIVSRDDRYFQDTYQAMPKAGFTALFERMLDHPNIEVELSVDFKSVPESEYDKVVYCGALDEYFDYAQGPLPYRSLRFEFETLDRQSGAQPVGTMNYPNEFDFTRTTEFSHLTGERRETVTRVTEYPQAYQVGLNEPYYPVPSPQAKALLAPYRAMAEALAGSVWFAGRLGDFQYYNMDQAAARGLTLFEKELLPYAQGAGR